MKLYRCLLLAAVFSLAGCKSDKDKQDQTPEPPAGVSVKIMTYNTYSGRKKGIDAIAEIIKSQDPDLVGLQEIESNSDDFSYDVPKALAEKTGMPYYYLAKALDLDPGDYGNLILSKYPLSQQTTYELGLAPGGPNSYMRAMGLVKTQKDGKEFYFATAHLDQLSDETNRLYQADLIHTYTKDLDKPVIITGDFNAQPTDATIKLMTQWFTLGCLNGHCGYTDPAPKPDGTIDYIMYAPIDSVSTVTYDVDYQAYSQSDHFPVVANLVIH
ncbi:Metal-dependent hydrolase, endonuclease/exonuclease/phosphatase family [bacterium A37T11]|nr:Metal-dependent hydrolase, endonuclease/exonuclease/phosphatase family [bacterium A37T11]